MIRPLTDDDREAVLSFVLREPETNLFLIGDLENYGMRTDFQNLWGEFNPAGELRAVLLRFYENLMFYAPEGCHWTAFAQIMESVPFINLMGGERSLAPLLQSMSFSKTQRMILARLDNVTSPPNMPALDDIRPLLPEDVDRLIELRSHIPEFGPVNGDSIRRQLAEHHARGCWIEREGRMVALACTTAENSRSAMLVGIATLPPWRNRGFATALTARLCRELLAEGLTPCLFYDNPAAGSIYRRLGFREIGNYMLLRRS